MFLEYLSLFFISAVEGLTEFLPVSSTAHILVLAKVFKTKLGMEYIVGVQLGAVCAVFVLYKERMKVLFVEVFTFKPKLLNTIIIITVPSILCGVIFHKFNILNLISWKVIPINLIFGGVLMLIFRKYSGKEQDIMEISRISALKIGLFQVLAFMPGMSRSASVIFGGLFTGLSRKCAIEISFLSGLPIIFAASVLEFFTSYSKDSAVQSLPVLLFSMCVAFVFACVGIQGLRFIANFKKDFEIFGVYRIIMGVVLFFIM